MKTTVIFAACREYKEDPATKATWFQTTPPYGSYPCGDTVTGPDGKTVEGATLVFDEKSTSAVMEAFNAAAKARGWPGVLVDQEHFSLDNDKPSTALAWAKDIRQDEDGSIWTRWEFTPRGRELWQSRTLVNRSPAFCCERSGKDYRPVALSSIAMTNTPHFKELSTLAAARAAEVNTHEGEVQMEEILKALGLAEGASPEDAVAAIEALKQKASAAEETAAEAEAKCRRIECDAFIEEHKSKIADVAACREAFMADPDSARKLMAACKAPESKPQTILAAAKKTPEVHKTGKAFASCREEMASLPPSERAAYYREHAAEIDV